MYYTAADIYNITLDVLCVVLYMFTTLDIAIQRTNVVADNMLLYANSSQLQVKYLKTSSEQYSCIYSISLVCQSQVN